MCRLPRRGRSARNGRPAACAVREKRAGARFLDWGRVARIRRAKNPGSRNLRNSPVFWGRLTPQKQEAAWVEPPNLSDSYLECAYAAVEDGFPKYQNERSSLKSYVFLIACSAAAAE